MASSPPAWGCVNTFTKDDVDRHDAENGHDRETEDFELHGFMSDAEDDEDGSRRMLRMEGGAQSFQSNSQSTAGKNSQARA